MTQKKINMNLRFFTISLGVLSVVLMDINQVRAAEVVNTINPTGPGLTILLILSISFLVLFIIWMLQSSERLKRDAAAQQETGKDWLKKHISNLESEDIEKLINTGDKEIKPTNGKLKSIREKSACIAFLALTYSHVHAQAAADKSNVMSSPGMMIMISLVLIPLLVTVYFIAVKINSLSRRIRQKRAKATARSLVKDIQEDYDPLLEEQLITRKQALDYTLNNTELAGTLPANDKKGLIKNIDEIYSARFIAAKKRAAKKHHIDPKLIRLILWYLGTATLWLVLGTSIGEYLGIKFTAPDIDHISWLSFGRLRPVHTNMVFWGWSSLAMLGLGYYVVATVSNAPIASLKKGYQSLVLINASVVSGSLCLMAGINNSGGEYREYIWPVMGLFAAGLVISLVNYMQTISSRKTKEIYISNWYVIAAMMFLTVIALVGYLPWWQDGLGETIVQGYYMHQAVGMWFMLFNLGLMYYFLPQQLNTPIYSYSLGILAFWSQILFYTLIGTHHFIFSSIPWWLQTVAIVGSMGMLIPVISGTTNFLMTLRGNYSRIGSSYTLPFYLVGIIFYFAGSTQGTAEAFRETNLVWHFTDFTVAHSHMTMYGIIAFMLWGCIYTLVPRLTGKEPNQGWVGAHFWMALIGLLFYSISLMVGGTLKGMGWVEGKPFIDGVVSMAPYWLWRAIGGSLMWASHLVFAWNMYTMIAGSTEADISKEVMEEIANIKVEPVIQ
jgi:cytochrome c oxidase cbb3-type subunit 1